MLKRILAPTALAALLVAAGCGADESPQPLADPSTSPSASPSPTVPQGLDTAAPDPPGDESRDAASAKEYAAYVGHVIQHAIRIRDMSPIYAEVVDQAACTTCPKIAEFVKGLRDKQQWEIGDDIEIGALAVRRAQGQFVVAGPFRYPPVSYRDIDGEEKDSYGEQKYRLAVWTRWDEAGSRWRVVDFAYLAASEK